MKIKFNKLIMKNFMSFKEAELKLNDMGYTLVNGINENPDDLAKSNGSGKSTLFDAINWCLTGETIRGTKEVSRIGCNESCEVYLNCLINNNTFEITRTKDPSNLTIYINGENKSGKGIRDTQKLLETYLPELTPSLIGSVIILGQGLPQRFSNNTPSGRKEVLEKLSKSDFMIQDIKDKLSTRKVFLSDKIRGFEDSILKLTTRKEFLNKCINDNQIRLDSMSDDMIKSALKSNKELLEKESSSLNKISDELSLNESSLSELQSELLKLTEDHNKDLESIDLKYSNDINDLTYKLADNKAKSDGLSNEILRLKSIKDVCPTCGQKLPNVHKVDTTNLEEELSVLNEESISINNNLNTIKTALSTAKNGIKTAFESNTLKLNKNIQDIQSKINSLKDNKSLSEMSIRKFSAEIARLEAEADSFNDNKFKIERALEQDKSELNQIDEKILYTNNDLEDGKNHLDVNSKMLNLISRDFRGYLLTNVISFINNKSKEYSRELFETDKIEFILDGNNIDIYYDLKPYECLSGGERQKIDVIVQLAIRDMLCTHLDFSSNILVLDEISDNIDSVGAERLFNLISNKLNDVESVFIISHHSDYNLPIDNTITVIKDSNKISRIV